MNEGLWFVVLGVGMAASALGMARLKLKTPAFSALPLAGFTASGDPWTLDPDRRDPKKTSWRFRAAVSCPARLLLAHGDDLEPRAAQNQAGVLWSHEPLTPVSAPPGWSARADDPGPRAEQIDLTTALAKWPRDLPKPVVAWDTAALVITAELPAPDDRVREVLALADALTAPGGVTGAA